MDLTAKPCLDPIGTINFSENPTYSAQPLHLPGDQAASTRTDGVSGFTQIRNTMSLKLSPKGQWKVMTSSHLRAAWGVLQAGSSGGCSGMFLYRQPWHTGESWIIPEEELKCRVAAALEVRNPFSYQGEALWGASVQNFRVQFSSHNTSKRQLET